MKITIETSETDSRYSRKVQIETPHDDLNIHDVVDLLGRLLFAYGFADETVRDYLVSLAEE